MAQSLLRFSGITHMRRAIGTSKARIVSPQHQARRNCFISDPSQEHRSQSLDQAAIHAYRQWRFRPSALRSVKVPVNFRHERRSAYLSGQKDLFQIAGAQPLAVALLHFFMIKTHLLQTTFALASGGLALFR